MVNANQARPLVAFWLLAIVAAAITVLGLLHDSPRAPVHSAPPARVTTSGTPELVLGGVLRAQPDPALTSPLSPQLWQSPAPTPTDAVQISSATPVTGTHKAPAQSGTSTTRAKAHTTQTATASTTTSASGHGNGHVKPDRPGKTTTTTTATTTTTTTSGHGGGKPSDPGKAH